MLHSVSGLPPPLSGPSPTGQRQEPVQSHPRGPGLERWLQSPAHNKLRNQPGAQFCLPGAHASPLDTRWQAGLRHPTRPVSSPLPLPRPVTSHQVFLGEPQSQSAAVTPLPSCCSCWRLSLVTCSGQQRCLPHLQVCSPHKDTTAASPCHLAQVPVTLPLQAHVSWWTPTLATTTSASESEPPETLLCSTRHPPTEAPILSRRVLSSSPAD